MGSLETDVLVVGAGPAGLTASARLARAGVNALTITKYAGTADSQRAHITNQRTVEILRDLGVKDRLRRDAMPQHLMGTQIFATSFAGLELSRTNAWGAGIDRRTDYDRASPSAMCNISQHKLEPVILDAALRHGATIRFNSELTDVRQDEEGVTARVRDRSNDQEYEIRCKYLIGADGGRSTVASSAGFDFEGRFNIGEAISIWLDADLTKFAAHRSGAIAYIAPQSSEIWTSIWPCVTPWTEWNPFFSVTTGRPDRPTRAICTVAFAKRSAIRRSRSKSRRSRAGGSIMWSPRIIEWAAYSSRETRRIGTRRPMGSGRTPRCKTPIISPGSSH